MRYKFIILCLVSLTSFSQTLKGSFVELARFGIYEKDSNKPVGAFPDLAHEIEKRSGIKLDYKLVPLKRNLLQLQNGEVDFTILFMREQYKNNVEIVSKVDHLTMHVFLKKGIGKKNKEDVKQVAVLLGQENVAHEILKGVGIKDYQLVIHENFEQKVELLKLGRVDAMLYPFYGPQRKLIKTIFGENTISKDILTYNRDMYFFITKNSPYNSKEIKGKIKSAILSMQRDGSTKRIFSKYWKD